MMLPILISVSVTPGSYFFWASALLPLAVSKMRADENRANRRVMSIRPMKSRCFMPDPCMPDPEHQDGVVYLSRLIIEAVQELSDGNMSRLNVAKGSCASYLVCSPSVCTAAQ